jgi:hypothetical protein
MECNPNTEIDDVCCSKGKRMGEWEGLALWSDCVYICVCVHVCVCACVCACVCVHVSYLFL